MWSRRSFWFVPLGVFLAFALLAGCSASHSGSQLVGKYAPLTRFQLVDGGFIPLEQYRGKTVVLTFWATWCSKSNQLLSQLGELSAKLAPQGTVVFLNASVDNAEQLEKVQTRLRDPALATTVNAFSGNAEYDEAFMSFRCNDLPNIFVISPVGVVVANGNTIDTVKTALGLTS